MKLHERIALIIEALEAMVQSPDVKVREMNAIFKRITELRKIHGSALGGQITPAHIRSQIDQQNNRIAAAVANGRFENWFRTTFPHARREPLPLDRRKFNKEFGVLDAKQRIACMKELLDGVE